MSWRKYPVITRNYPSVLNKRCLNKYKIRVICPLTSNDITDYYTLAYLKKTCRSIVERNNILYFNCYFENQFIQDKGNDYCLKMHSNKQLGSAMYPPLPPLSNLVMQDTGPRTPLEINYPSDSISHQISLWFVSRSPKCFTESQISGKITYKA